jgi:hypothetical protein
VHQGPAWEGQQRLGRIFRLEDWLAVTPDTKRSTESTPWLSSALRSRSASIWVAAAPWLLSMASQALGWLALN